MWALMAYRQLVTLCEVVGDLDRAVLWLSKTIDLFEEIRIMVADPDVHQDLADRPVFEDLDVDLGLARVDGRDDVAALDRVARLDAPADELALRHVGAE